MFKGSRRCQAASWCLYDFANSSYSAVILAVLFPVYFSKAIAQSPTQADLWWGWAISISMALVALSSPLMGGISDYSGRRKRLLFIYTLTACVSTAALFIPQKGDLLLATMFVVIANTTTEGAFVFYNAYLNDIADKGSRGRLSGLGFGAGYLGSIVSLFVALWMFNRGLSYLIWPFTGAFFLFFSVPAFLYLPADTKKSSIINGVKKGIEQTIQTLKEVTKNKRVLLFLASYFLYKDALNTIIIFSSLFASTTLGFKEKELLFLYLFIQAMAALGAFVFSGPTDRWGPWKVVMLSISVWFALSVWTFLIKDKTSFWVVASAGGVFLGTLQAASRALFTRFIPPGKEAEYFGVYALSGKTSSIIGPAAFGLISSITGNQRMGVLLVAGLFLSGGLLMLKIREN
ncbi:MAG: MFS transporter [Nitrospirae bacterium]|nr:MFS transporter [Nitrospirota bacterium]